VITPAVVMRPILLLKNSVNHSAPSGPAAMSKGLLLAVESVDDSLMTPAVVMRPILLPRISANHSAPSGPAVIPKGLLLAVGIGKSVMNHPVLVREI
jgi:hypothetical protein